MPAISIWKHRLNILQRICARSFYKLLGKANARLQSGDLFCIKQGYHHATSAENFDATASTDEYQRKVYELALARAQQLKDPSILDVGCGSAYKLVNMLGQYNISGIEVEPTYSWLQKQYPGRKWLLFETTDPGSLQADIVICADVIEHFQNPDALMDFLSAIRFKYLILSTPERDKIRGKGDYGPPVNTAHYREWNTGEFKNYVSQWFTLLDHHIVNDKSISQVAICLPGKKEKVL